MSMMDLTFVDVVYATCLSILKLFGFAMLLASIWCIFLAVAVLTKYYTNEACTFDLLILL